MRLDLFLKNTRLAKRRSAAKALAGEGGVLLNGHPAKPGRDVKAGDELTFLQEEGAARRVRVLAEARRPVPKGREGEFFAWVDPR
jgi:ribosomal 50S subunit-recycling heat shock protein